MFSGSKFEAKKHETYLDNTAMHTFFLLLDLALIFKDLCSSLI